MGKYIGSCVIESRDGKVYGHFTLQEEMEDEKYVLYLVSNWDKEKVYYLEGIAFVNVYDNVASRAKTIAEMHVENR